MAWKNTELSQTSLFYGFKNVNMHAQSHSESRPGIYGSGSEAGAVPIIPSTPHLPCSLSVTQFRRIKAKPFYFSFSISFLGKVFGLVISVHCPHRPRGIWEADRSEPWAREKARPALVLVNGRLQGACYPILPRSSSACLGRAQGGSTQKSFSFHDSFYCMARENTVINTVITCASTFFLQQESERQGIKCNI